MGEISGLRFTKLNSNIDLVINNDIPEIVNHSNYIGLLTLLHSKSKKRVDAFWPLGEIGGLRFTKLNSNIDLVINNDISEIVNHSNYIEHTFRLSKIHTWIKKWSDTEMINQNTSHHLSIGDLPHSWKA